MAILLYLLFQDFDRRKLFLLSQPPQKANFCGFAIYLSVKIQYMCFNNGFGSLCYGRTASYVRNRRIYSSVNTAIGGIYASARQANSRVKALIERRNADGAAKMPSVLDSGLYEKGMAEKVCGGFDLSLPKQRPNPRGGYRFAVKDYLGKNLTQNPRLAAERR